MDIALINWHIIPKKTPLGGVPSDGLDAAYDGLVNIGLNVKRFHHYLVPQTELVVCWGYGSRVGRRLSILGKQCLVLELGYIGDRARNISIGWNGLNGHATFADYPEDGGERFRSFGGELRPWKEGGDYILILGQVKGDASLRDQDIIPWYEHVASEAKRIYELPVYFRPHPEAVRRGGYHTIPGVENITGSFADNLNGALFTIAYNSNSCLDSIMAGTPCYAGDAGTMAYDLCMKDIAEIVRPEREQIVHRIAWCQFTLDEIRSGWPIERALECGRLLEAGKV